MAHGNYYDIGTSSNVLTLNATASTNGTYTVVVNPQEWEYDFASDRHRQVPPLEWLDKRINEIRVKL